MFIMWTIYYYYLDDQHDSFLYNRNPTTGSGSPQGQGMLRSMHSCYKLCLISNHLACGMDSRHLYFGDINYIRLQPAVL